MLNRVGARSVVAPVEGAPAGGGARAEAERTHNARHALDAAGLPWAAGAMRRDPNIQPFAHNDVGEL